MNHTISFEEFGLKTKAEISFEDDDGLISNIIVDIFLPDEHVQTCDIGCCELDGKLVKGRWVNITSICTDELLEKIEFILDAKQNLWENNGEPDYDNINETNAELKYEKDHEND